MTNKNKTEKLIIYTDGGSRGNPGPAAVGVVIKDESGKLIKSYADKIGETTNNEAEYQAVIFALKKIKALFGKEKIKSMGLEVRMDSELVAKQLNGEYKIEERSLQPLFMEIWNLKTNFGKINFGNVPREKNKEADHLVNVALDKSQTNLFS